MRMPSSASCARRCSRGRHSPSLRPKGAPPTPWKPARYRHGPCEAPHRHGTCCRPRQAPGPPIRRNMPPANETSPLRVLLIDDGAHRVGLIRDELTRQGHVVVGVIDSALLIHDCVLAAAARRGHRRQRIAVARHARAPGHGVGHAVRGRWWCSPRTTADAPMQQAHEGRRQRLRDRRAAAAAAGCRCCRWRSPASSRTGRCASSWCRREAQLSRAQGGRARQGHPDAAEVGLRKSRPTRQLRKLAMDRGAAPGAGGRTHRRRRTSCCTPPG